MLHNYDSRNFIGIHHERIKTLGLGNPNPKGTFKGATGRHMHHTRGIDTPNAVPELLTDNLVYCADTEWNGLNLDKTNPVIQRIVEPDYVKNLVEAELVKVCVNRTGKGKRGKIRSDSNILEELLIWASPAWFRDGNLKGPVNQDKVNRFLKHVVGWLRLKFGKNLIIVYVHFDESNPHLNAFVLPLARKLVKPRGRPSKTGAKRKAYESWVIDSAAYFSPDIYLRGGHKPKPGLCSQNQTQLAEYVREHGLDLERGIEDSGLTQRRMRSNVQLIHHPLPILPHLEVPLPDRAFESKAQYYRRVVEELGEQLEQTNKEMTLMHEKANAFDLAHKCMVGYQVTSVRERKEKEKSEAELDEQKREMAKAKALITKLQAGLADAQVRLNRKKKKVDLKEIAKALEMGKPMRKVDRNLACKLDEHRVLSVSAEEFTIVYKSNQRVQKIDKFQNPLHLIQMIVGCSLEEAGAWLSKAHGSELAESSFSALVAERQDILLKTFAEKMPKHIVTTKRQMVADDFVQHGPFRREVLEELVRSGHLQIEPVPNNQFRLQWMVNGAKISRDTVDSTGRVIETIGAPCWHYSGEGSKGKPILLVSSPTELLALSTVLPHLIDQVQVEVTNLNEPSRKDYLRQLQRGVSVVLACSQDTSAMKLSETQSPRLPLFVASPAPYHSWAEAKFALGNDTSAQIEALFHMVDRTISKAAKSAKGFSR